ncbi:MAG: DNA-3-methyladenine glycosylase I [Acetobacter sp.]|jgi:DNA-3-methyladenine glycosylase I
MTPPLHRCRWAQNDLSMQLYHDTEWGVPVRDSRALWEKLILDGFQAGLSWRTILLKREAFREAFEGFIPARVARSMMKLILSFYWAILLLFAQELKYERQ